jgi:cellulose synthase operon protein C
LNLFKNILYILILSFAWQGHAENVLNDLKLNKNFKKNEEKSLKAELLIQKTEKKAIKQIKKLIKKYKGTELEADMQLRLAELYMRRSKTAQFFELNRESETVVRFMPKEIKDKSSKYWIKKAIAIYDYIQLKYPKSSNLDLVIFNEAMACQQIALNQKSEKLYWKLIKNFKYSPLVADAHLAIGEINFSRKKFNKALNHFNAIKAYPNSRVYPYGLYKAGWSLYNLRDSRSGLLQLEKVVAYGVFASKNNVDARLDLRKEALSDMTLFFEDVHSSKYAYDYFKKQSGDIDVTLYLLKLANLYGRHNKVKDELVIYNDYLKHERNSDLVPMLYSRLISAYETLKDRKAAVKQLAIMSDFCHNSHSWDKSKQIDLISNCHKELQKTALHFANKWLRMWGKNKKYPIFAKVAEKSFWLYLESKEKSFEKTKVRYVLAELLFNQQKFYKSSQQYAIVGGYLNINKQRIFKIKKILKKKNLDKKYRKEVVADLQKIKFDKMMAHDADYAALLSLEKQKVKAKIPHFNRKDEKLFKKLAEYYVGRHKNPKYKLDIQFKLALIYYNNNQFKPAKKLFKQLGDKFANKDKGVKSQDLYLDILNKDKDYSLMIKYSKNLMKKSKGSKLRYRKLQLVFQQSSFLTIQQSEDKQELKNSIKNYKNFALSNLKSDLAPKAWVNAIELEYKMKRPVIAAQSSKKYAQLFPKENNRIEYLLRSAKVYEGLALLGKASSILLDLSNINTIGKKFVTQQEGWKKLAADYEYLSGDMENAAKIYLQLVSSTNKEIRTLSLVNLEKIYSLRGHGKLNSKKHTEVIDQIIVQNIQPESSLLLLKNVEKYYLNNDFPLAFAEAKKVLKMKGDTSSYAMAKARLIQAKILKQEFIQQSLKTSLSRLTMVLQLKTGKLEKAQKAYRSTIKYGDAMISIEALSDLSDLYAVYSEQLRSMPYPKDLPENSQVAFRSEIENLAMPMEDNSIDTLVNAIKQVKTYNVYGDIAKNLQKKLDRKNMKAPENPIVQMVSPEVILPIHKEVRHEI